MANHSSILAWRIPWTKEPGGLQPMGSQRVRHERVANTHTHTHTHTHIFMIEQTTGIQTFQQPMLEEAGRKRTWMKSLLYICQVLNLKLISIKFPYSSPWLLLFHRWEMSEGLFHTKRKSSIAVKRWWWRFSCQVASNSCNPMDCSLPGSSVHGILQARTLEWVAISFSKQLKGWVANRHCKVWILALFS